MADEAVPVGTVISWSIPDQPTLKVGDSVVKGTTVSLNVSTGPALREVPNLVGITLVEATAKLTEMGLVIAEGPQQGHPEIAAGKVMAQLPAAAEKLAKGGTVTITISKGSGHNTHPHHLRQRLGHCESALVGVRHGHWKSHWEYQARPEECID